MKGRFAGLAFLACLIWAIALYTGLAAWYFVLWLILFSVIFSALAVLISRFYVSAENISKSKSCLRGQEISISVKITNHSLIPFVRAEIRTGISISEKKKKNIVTLLSAKSSGIIEYTVFCAHCGKFDFAATALYISDPLGLFVIKGKLPAGTSSAYVTPIPVPLPLWSRIVHAGAPRHQLTQKTQEHEDLAEIHPFSSDDSIKNIHWKQSARRSVFMAAAYEKPRDSGLLMIADLNCCDIHDAEQRGDVAGDCAVSFMNAAIGENRCTHTIILRKGKQFNIIAATRGAAASAALPFSELQPVKWENACSLLPFVPLASQLGALIYICYELTQDRIAQLAVFRQNNIPVHAVLCCGKPAAGNFSGIGVSVVNSASELNINEL